MKNYNTCNDMNSPETKVDRPVSSLLTGSLKISPSASAALLVGILEIVVGVILLFPGVLGIIYVHWGLVIYGCYGLSLIAFGVVGYLGIRKHAQSLLHAFFIWKIVSVFIVAGITITVILLVHYNLIPMLSSWWFTIVIIGGLGLVFEFWSIGGILWVRPLWLEYKDVPLGIPDDTVDIPMISQDIEGYVPPPPQLGVAPAEDPMRVAVRIFNKHPDQGLRYLIDRGLIDGSFRDIAKFLHTADDLNSSKLGDFLGENKPFNIGVLQAYTDYFDFSNMEFDNGLREFLLPFRLPGEAQKIDRIMECFAQRYAANNPGIFPDSDTAYLLAFSLIMLNTDAHNPAIKHKMSKKAFVANNTGIRGKDDIPVNYLEHLYDRIVTNEIKMESDGLFTRAAFKGWLEKRSTHSKWQKRWFVLKNNCLYYFNKPEEESPRVIIPLEGLLVRKIETPTTSSSSHASLSSMFEIADPYQQSLKCVKFTANGPIEGHHQRFILMAATREEADEWVNILQNNNLNNPIIQLLKRRRNIIMTRQTTRVPPQATIPPIVMDGVEVIVSTPSTGLTNLEDNYSRTSGSGSSSSSSNNNSIHTSSSAGNLANISLNINADINNTNTDTSDQDDAISNIENTMMSISNSAAKPPSQENSGVR